jgi:hypothetical protein
MCMKSGAAQQRLASPQLHVYVPHKQQLYGMNAHMVISACSASPRPPHDSLACDTAIHPDMSNSQGLPMQDGTKKFIYHSACRWHM